MLKTVINRKGLEFEPKHTIKHNGDVISFCVYGNIPKYTIGAIHNAVLAPQIYPGWCCRFYIESRTRIASVLKDLNCEVYVAKNISMSKGSPHPMIWKLLALEDKNVNRVIFRDVDSRLNHREKAAVDAWIESGQQFHRIKEKWHLSNPALLGGMWGATGQLPIQKMIDSFNWNRVFPFEEHRALGGDLPFLQEHVWEKYAKRDCLYHGVENDAYQQATPFPKHPPINCDFVGSIVIDDTVIYDDDTHQKMQR